VTIFSAMGGRVPASVADRGAGRLPTRTHRRGPPQRRPATSWQRRPPPCLVADGSAALRRVAPSGIGGSCSSPSEFQRRQFSGPLADPVRRPFSFDWATGTDLQNPIAFPFAGQPLRIAVRDFNGDS
jgi:hypothetical protein